MLGSGSGLIFVHYNKLLVHVDVVTVHLVKSTSNYRLFQVSTQGRAQLSCKT